jgi:hypothetical protein
MAKLEPVAAASNAAPDMLDNVLVELDGMMSSYVV